MAYLLHQLLQNSARRFPDKEAVRFQGATLTYQEVDQVTNKVAQTLLDLGVRRGDRVGIFVSKSLASIIATFGVLKSGAVYVPIDPSAPAQRLSYILNNCGIKILLSTPEKLKNIEEIVADSHSLQSVILMANCKQGKEIPLKGILQIIPWSVVQSKSDRQVMCTESIDGDLAYILYTSGSTGHPKGVMVSHRAIFTFLNWCYEKFSITENDRIPFHAPLHFDLSTFEIFVTIMAGGTIIIVPENLSVFPVQLVELLESEKITVVYLVPSILSMMVNYGELDTHDLTRVRMVLFAGEVFPIKYLRKLTEKLTRAEFYNLYGPTETNVCTYYKVQGRDVYPDQRRPLPIGIACENIEVFAVNDDGQKVTKPGERGELWVRGACLAHGYWGDLEKTTQRFINNSFQENFTDLAYKTGDIVMLDQDGVNWEFIGRNDHMVKSRGYRIELGEIESALYHYPGVKEVAVVAIPDELIGNRLKAYVVPMDGTELAGKEIETHCWKCLPRYMIPESIELCQDLPKTSTGKINRPLLACV
ncbi:amino acid adenylation domain-containing protein [Candidatus Nitronereus thalassa]|uniref:Amino acid adenylation domain-containing protein n=1 Tax=Candidatus Nitronereus thalassa TaxID=3020898 RepID=A0ABU3K566_9BACT|nr:amino acid adenylation domain-containing protein [Candidatus Nitronereus thalassa]MDT7041547.1 amino acid adenylation domain-containing protein [Candidatus Nitronereus thalassa]